MKITHDQINKIFDLAKYYYKDINNPELNADEIICVAWIMAVNSVLTPEIQLEFPQRNSTDSVFDD